MTTTLDAFQADTWATRQGAVPIDSLSPSQAQTAIEWGSSHAGNVLRQHRDRMSDADYLTAAQDPASWWQNTALCQALDARTSTGSDDESATITVLDQMVMVEEPSAASQTTDDAVDGHLDGSVPDTLNVAVPDDTPATEPEPFDARAVAVAERRADEANARADDLNQTVAERDAELEQLKARDEQLVAEHADLVESSDALRAEHAALVDVVTEQQSRLEHLEPLAATNTELEQQLAAQTERLTELDAVAISNAESDDRSARRLNMVVTGGTALVLISVAILVYVGGYHAAYHYAGWPPILAALLPLSIEAGAAVELASLVRNRRLGLKSHWTAPLLASGLLGLSITAMLLHASGAPDGSFAWWGYVVAVALPLELAALVRASLGNGRTH